MSHKWSQLMNWRPLPTLPPRPPPRAPSRQVRERREGAAVRTEHEPDAKENAPRRGRRSLVERLLPGDARLDGEAVSRGGALVADRVPGVAVDGERGGLHEH